MANRKGPNDDQRPNKPQSGKLTRKWGQIRAGSDVARLGWETCDGAAVMALVCAVTNQGGAIILGRTRDGGALMVTILDGDETLKEYIPSGTDVTEVVWALAGALGDD